MGVELVPNPKAPKNRSLAIRLIARFHPLRMLLFGRSARVLKMLAMESSLKTSNGQKSISFCRPKALEPIKLRSQTCTFPSYLQREAYKEIVEVSWSLSSEHLLN